MHHLMNFVDKSNMLFGNLSKILFPVLCEALLFFSQLVVFLHDFLNGGLEPILIDLVVLVSGFDNRLVLDRVFDLYFGGKFVLHWGARLLIGLFGFLFLLSVLWEQGLKIDVKYISPKSWPLSSGSLREIRTLSLGGEHFDVGVLLLDNFVSG